MEPLDQLASLARTALTDPQSLPDGNDLADVDMSGWPLGTHERVVYAVGKLDEIVNTLNPSEWTRENAAQALRALGRHISDVSDGIGPLATQDDALNGDPEMDPFGFSVLRIQDALDLIDSAIRTLEGDELFCEECGEAIRKDASPGVYVHADEERGHDLDAEHVARPDYGTANGN